MARWTYARQLVEEAFAQRSADQLDKKYHRFDEAYDGLKWQLARRCDRILSLVRRHGGVNYHLYRQAGDAIAGTPDISVLYTFDDDQVNIIGVTADEPLAEID